MRHLEQRVWSALRKRRRSPEAFDDMVEAALLVGTQIKFKCFVSTAKDAAGGCKPNSVGRSGECP